MDQINILVVDDEKEIADLVEIYLVSDGYKVFKANNALDGLEILEKEEIHLVLLDIMLPEEDGLSILKKLRTSRDTKKLPVIMLTAKGSEYDTVLGLDNGADDYIPKPFRMMELISRIRALLRRSQEQEKIPEYRLGSLYVCPSRHIVRVDGTEIILTLKEFELLCLLLSEQETVFTRAQLLDRIWGYEFDGESRTIDVHVRTLRQKLGSAGDCIKTVRGVGYKIGGKTA